MAGETIIRGREGILSVYDANATPTPVYKPVACLTSTSLSSTLSILESNTKCDPGQTVRTPDQLSYEISVDGEYVDTTSVGGETTLASHDFLFSLQQTQQSTGATNIFRLETGLADTTYYCNAILSDLVLDQSATENSTFSATLQVSGAVVTTDPTV